MYPLWWKKMKEVSLQMWMRSRRIDTNQSVLHKKINVSAKNQKEIRFWSHRFLLPSRTALQKPASVINRPDGYIQK